jgi:hypothetical protein
VGIVNARVLPGNQNSAERSRSSTGLQRRQEAELQSGSGRRAGLGGEASWPGRGGELAGEGRRADWGGEARWSGHGGA